MMFQEIHKTHLSETKERDIEVSVLSTPDLFLTRSIRDFEISIDFVQGPPDSRRERVNRAIHIRELICFSPFAAANFLHHFRV